jgi:Domain of unknown function (DUF4926)
VSDKEAGMIRELDTIVLTHDVEEHGLKRGDVGAVVHRYEDGAALEVEFVTAEGRTLAVLTLTGQDVRPLGERDILHARELAAA